MSWKTGAGIVGALKLALLLAISLPDPAAAAGETRQTFRHWLGICTGGGVCQASAFVKPGDGPNGEAYALTVLRQPGPASDWHIAFATYNQRPAADSEITVEIDDKSPLTLRAGRGISDLSGTGLHFIIAERALDGMLKRMQAGSNYSVTFEESGQTWRTIQFSLRGITAALNWIDTQQSRQFSAAVTIRCTADTGVCENRTRRSAGKHPGAAQRQHRLRWLERGELASS